MVAGLESLKVNRVLAERVELSFLCLRPLRFGWSLSEGRRELVAKSQYIPWTRTDERTTFNSWFFASRMRPVTSVPRGSTVFPSTLTGLARLAANESPQWFLSLARVCPTVAVITVPLGKVTRWSGCVGSAMSPAGLTVAAPEAAPLAACTDWRLATMPGWFEHAATVKKPRTAAVSDSLR